MIHHLLKELECEYGNSKAFVYEKAGVILEKNYGEFVQNVIELSQSFRIINRAIALMGNNSYSWVISFFAILYSGNKAVLVPPNETEEKRTYILKDAECTYVVAENKGEFLNDIGYNQEINIDKNDVSVVLYKQEVETENETQDYDVLIYTSGSGGVPKGVRLSLEGIWENAKSICRRISFAEGVFLSIPLYHAYAMTVGLFSTLYIKNWVYLGKTPFQIDELSLARTKSMITVPAIAEHIKRHLDQFYDISEKHTAWELSQILCGGAFLKEDIERFYVERGFDLITGYGMTECGTVVSAENTQLKRLGSVGKVLDCYEIKIENQLEEGFGEIFVRGKSLMKGYLNEDSALEEDGFYRTGDIGFLDEDGYLFIRGRVKNLIVFNNGKKMVPEELETQIRKINYVSEVVISLYKEKKAEYLVALIELQEGCTDKESEESVYEKVIELNKKLPFYMQVKKVIFGEGALERTTLSKVRRGEVQKILENKSIPLYLLDILEEISDVRRENIKIKDNLVTDLGLDSLQMWSLLIELEKVSNVSDDLNFERLSSFVTVEDIVEVIS